MLKSLKIKNYALIENIEVSFGKGLNIITGETGAGKSILIGALGMILGERATTETIRKGTKKTIVEAVFDVSNNSTMKKLLEQNNFDWDDELIIRREVSVKGNNRNFVNDTPATLGFIKEIGNLLVDIHGQHEHQSLLRPGTHIKMLDEYGNYGELLNEYKEQYQSFETFLRELKELKEKEDFLKEKRELYEFQLKEIDEISPEEKEDEKIEGELKILENAERILELTESAYSELYENEGAITDRLGFILNALNELARYDESLQEKYAETESAFAILDEVARFLASYKSKIELDPERLEELRERFAAINRLKKKYGGSLEAVLSYREKINSEKNIADNFEEEIKKLQEEIERKRNQLLNIGKRLSEARQAAGKNLKAEIQNSLKYLGIESAIFETNIERENAPETDPAFADENGKRIKLFANGIDKVEFLISTNLGESPMPLSKVASGGEISRIMLAIKSSLAKNEKLPLLIFDEIDAGVSGRIARKVGKALKELSRFHQIIAITHLPQIAAMSDNHYRVSKTSLDGRTVSTIEKVDAEEKLKEVAKLLSGETVTESALASARELIDYAEKEIKI